MRKYPRVFSLKERERNLYYERKMAFHIDGIYEIHTFILNNLACILSQRKGKKLKWRERERENIFRNVQIVALCNVNMYVATAVSFREQIYLSPF